jgi:homoserine O-acetyltransferase
MLADHSVFELGDFELQSGELLPGAQLAYKTYGSLNAERDNVVVLPTFYTGSHMRNEGFFGPGRAIDAARHFVVSVNMFGNGISSSPSNTPEPFDAAGFPPVTLYDNVRAQFRLLTEELGVARVALVTGWSMAGCQSFQWAAQSDGNYSEAPVKGLKAFGRVYAGWAFSQTFYREKMYRLKGFDSAEELLQDWEQDHLDWDANDLLCKLWTWQQGDISANALYNGDFKAALNAIEAKTIVIVCDNDLYFRPEDNQIEIEHIAGGELRIYQSPWGHCVASPGNDPEFEHYLDQAISELLVN